MNEEREKLINDVIADYLSGISTLTEQVRTGVILPTSGMIKAAEVGLSCLQRLRGEQ
jgi:hypothetical protein